MTTLADELVPDALWAPGGTATAIPAAPAIRRSASHHPRPQLLRRDCVHGAHVYAVAAAARELGCGSPATCWRRLTQWAAAGVFDQLHLAVLDRLGEQGQVDWSRASVDTMSVRAKRGDHVGANPVDRGKPGSKLHLLCDGSGLPLTAAVTAANIADVTMLVALVDDIPPVRTSAKRRRARPGKVHADKGYDGQANRAYLRRRGIRSRIARRGVESSSGLGRQRWRIERTLSWLSWYRRLGVRWDRGSERWFAFVLLACSLVCFNRL